MSKPMMGAAGQMGPGGFGDASVVKLDGGKRLRLDDRVDFWPATQTWTIVVGGLDGPASGIGIGIGIGITRLLDDLKRTREAQDRPWPRQ
jgi:hypothetical protein